MALAMQSNMAAQDDVMDIDIDMDIDEVGPVMEDDMLEEGEEPSFQPSRQDPSGIIPAIYTEDPAQEPQWQKVYIRGVDDMHTNDILAFCKDHFPHADPHIQWIDDTSANIVFENNQTAREALLAFVQNPTTSQSIANAPFEDRTAKQLASRPASIFIVRVAQAADRKRKNARDASRYYLLHPDEDPSENPRRGNASNRSGRAENGDYKRRRFDEREHRRRRDHDHNPETEDFSAAMYDDAPSTNTPTDGSRGRDLSSRVTKSRRRSASPGAEAMSDISDEDARPRRRKNGYRDRSNPPPYTKRDPHPHPRSNVGKELFSDPTKKSSGLHSDRMDSAPSTTTLPSQSQTQPLTTEQRQTNSAVARRLKADLLASIVPSPKPQQPQTSPRNGRHRRSHAMDAKNDEDLAERFGRKSISIDSTKSLMAKTANTGVELFPSNNGGGGGGGGLNIRNAMNEPNTNMNGLSIKGSGGFSIRGRAGADQVKELFPDQYSKGNVGNGGSGTGNGITNKGKELFDEPVRRKGPRQRAGDLFD